MSSLEELERRVRRLEAVEEIKKLKAHYWYACDHKDVEAVRDCFVDGPCEIAYDGPVGTVHHRDGLYEVFEKVACHTEIVEIHHGGPPQIEWVDDDHARATWGLVYHLMNTELGTISQAGGYYHDEYTRVGGQWKISKAHFRVVSVLTTRWKDRDVQFVYAGNQIPEAKAT